MKHVRSNELHRVNCQLFIFQRPQFLSLKAPLNVIRIKAVVTIMLINVSIGSRINGSKFLSPSSVYILL